MKTEPLDIRALIESGPDLIASLNHVIDWTLIGAELYMPPEECTGVSWLVLLSESALACADELECAGWIDISNDEDEQWPIVINGKGVTLILTESRDYFDLYKLAMEICNGLNLTTEAERHTVCKIVRDGLTADQAMS